MVTFSVHWEQYSVVVRNHVDPNPHAGPTAASALTSVLWGSGWPSEGSLTQAEQRKCPFH